MCIYIYTHCVRLKAEPNKESKMFPSDDITVIVKNQKEPNQVNWHLKIYKEVSAAKLNHIKQRVSGLGGKINRQILIYN